MTDSLSGVTLVPGSVQVTPIAFDDLLPSIVGNTPITITAAQLLGNDVDPDGAEINLTITGVSNATHGTIVDNGNGTYTFTPTTGYAGSGANAASFQYTITDEQGLGSVTTGIVTFDVTDPVWYVNNATGSDVTGDGSYAKPFASLNPLTTGGAADALDNADDTIFVYNAGTYANASIVLETNQKLFGDGHAFSVNGLTIGANASNTTLSHAAAAVTLATGNTIDGFDLVGTATGAVGIQDGAGTVGTLTVTGTNITGQGQIIDIDQGGTLAVTLGNIASTGSTGANGGVVDLTGVTGAVTVTGTTTINGTHSQAGIDISGNTGGLTVAFQGNVTVNNGANNAINIGSNTGTNTVTFSGGSKDIDTTSGTALNFTANTTTTTVAFTNGGLDVDTTSGTGLNMDNTTLTVSGAVNTVNTTTGNVLAIANSAIGAGNISFDTLGASGTVAAGAGISINNLDNGTFSGGNVTIAGTAGASADGLNIQGGSSSTFTFASATIGGGAAGTNPIAGDAIELNGANGAITITTVNLQGSAGVGLNIVGGANSVAVSGGTIGTTNDPGGDGVTVLNGSGAVTVAAAITKTTGGNEVVDVSGHSTGAISISGALNSSSGGGGIRLVNNTSGNIDFTNSAVNLNTGTLAAITFTNTAGTGAAVTFSGGSLNVDTTSGTGINATNSTVGAGSLTISGASNSLLATTGRAINIDGVTSTLTFHDVGVSGGGTTTGVFLKNTGAGGQFIVTGDVGTSNQGSGGTIANITGADAGSVSAAPATGTGMYLENVSNVSLSNMIFGSSTAGQNLMSNFGIRGESVNNFTLTDSEFRGTFGSSAALDEDTIRFGTQGVSTGLSGTAVFQGNNIQGGKEVGLEVHVNGSSSLNITIKDTAGGDQAVFGNNDANTGTDDFLLESGGTSHVTVLVNGVDFNGSRGDLMQIASLGATVQNITITNNQFLNGQVTDVDGGTGVAITGQAGGSNITYNIDGNTFKGTRGASIYSMFNGDSGTITGIVNNNTFGTPNGVKDSTQGNYGSLFGGAFFGGIDSKFPGTGSLNYALRISNNTIRDSGSDGVIMLRSANQGLQGTARLEATISNNTIAEVGANVAAGVYAQVAGSGTASGDNGKIGLNISGNSFNMAGATFANGVYVDNGSSLSGTAYMPSYVSPLSTYLAGKGNSFAPGGASSKLGDVNGTIIASNFVLAVPALAADPNVGKGWEELIAEKAMSDPRVDTSGEPGSQIPADTSGDRGGEMAPADDDDSGGTSGTSGSDGSDAAPTAVPHEILTHAELGSLVEAAIQRWIDAGATPQQVEAMRAVEFGIVDMAGIFVGASEHGVINIDVDGAGFGWFVDATPSEDSEFEGSGTRLAADAGGSAEGELDLLTVLMHELGHQIGLDDEYQASEAADLMFGYMNVGERRLPTSGEASGAVPGSIGTTAFALTPVSVGTLPTNKTVDIFFKATVDAQTDKFIAPLSNDSTISGSNFSNVIAHENNALDSLTLGNTVFSDANLNGMFDAGEGVVGVALELYADTNDSGGWDPGDVLLGSTTTGALGAYSFTGLAPGDYIVVIKASNFSSGQPLFGLQIVQGVAADPDDNVDNDNNGTAAAGGAVASQTITLAYNSEPTAGTGNDTNNTLDFGFVANQPPIGNDDNVTIAEDSGANDLTSQLLSNDTDPENDTKTITSATQGAHGTTSVVAGVLTYTPTGNYNGTDTFDYVINDGHAHTDTATVTVTVTAVNDPVTGTAPASASLNEDATNVAIAGMSISDVDATLAPAGVYDVTLSATHGTLTLTTTTGLTFGTGDGAGDTTMTFHGTLAAINTALATAKYTPDSNYNGSAQINLQVTDTFGGTVATGTGSATNDSDSVAVTVNSVNDEPVGANQDSNATQGVTYTFTAFDFSENFSDPNDTPANAFDAVKITTLPSAAAGTIKLNGVAISAGDVITKTQLDNNELTFVPAAGSGGTNPTFTFQVRDDGGLLNGGVNLDQSANTYTIHIAQADAAPVLDLDANDDNSVLGVFTSSYTEGGAAAAIADTDIAITDTDSGDDIVSAVIKILSPATGDKLSVGGLPSGITLDGSSTDTMVKLVGIPGTTADDMELAIKAVTYSNTDDPTNHGLNTARSITVVVNDGILDSNVATATVNVTDVNDAPTGTSATITASEDTLRVLTASDLGFNDVDGTLKSVTISAVTGGTIYFDSDGTGGADPVGATLPHTYTAADLSAGLVSFRAAQNANGSALGTITFTVTDDDGADAASSNTLTVNVAPVNDSPELTTNGPVATNEQTAVAFLTGSSVADVDLDALNGGSGDYKGSQISVSRSGGANAEDVFGLLGGPDFTLAGNDLKSGGLIFATITTNAGGQLVVDFNSQETPATSALVDEVIQSIQYTNSSDNPPVSVQLAYDFTDGAPGAGQGAGATSLDSDLVTVNITAVNDAPANSLGGTIGMPEDVNHGWLSGMSISDPDANAATDDMVFTFHVAHGTLDIRTDVANGVTLADVSGDNTGTVTVTATLNEINATLAASNGLAYSPVHNFNGNDTLTVTTNDQGHNGTDPGLTGDVGSEQDIDTRTISVSAIDDPAEAKPDVVSTAENVIGTGNLFADNGSGADTDAEGDAFQVTAVSGGTVGVPFQLPSGAILTVNSDGTYSYDPNGKFTTLTHTGNPGEETGAVNTSTVGDTFTYTVTGGSTVTVTVTVNGVAGPGDWLSGDGTDNVITGTAGNDLFMLQQGGNDTASGLDGNDAFYYGGALTSADKNDGGDGRDVVILQGNYNVTLGTDALANMEALSLQTGAATRWGDTANNFYDYVVTTVDANVAAGQSLIVNGSNLRAGEDFTFDGHLETDGSFFVYAGGGVDTLIGGAKGDIFFFEGTFSAGDTVDGGGGRDVVIITGGNGLNHFEVGAGTLTNVEAVSVSDHYASGPSAKPSYELVIADGNVIPGGSLIVNGNSIVDPSQTFAVDAHVVTGSLQLYGGSGADTLVSGSAADLVYGGDGADAMTGGGGSDRFHYRDISETTTSAADHILDFQTGIDKIDLAYIDANVNQAGDQAFTLSNDGNFHNVAGELRSTFDAGNGWYVVEGDVDGDGTADFAIHVTTVGAAALTYGDFLP